MSNLATLSVERVGPVAVLEFERPPYNHLDLMLLRDLASSLKELDGDPEVRAVVLSSRGKHFCAGADFSSNSLSGARGGTRRESADFYKTAAALFRTSLPIVAAVQGAAVGAGLGLSLVADFRVTCPEARFSGNFTRLGLHPGFGLTATLPRLIGQQNAARMFFTSPPVRGEEAVRIGLADLLSPVGDIRNRAIMLAADIAEGAPLAVRSSRATLRRGLADAVERAVERESVEQDWLAETEDFQTGLAAMRARVKPAFRGR